VQIGFLTSWQLFAQKIEGDEWRGNAIDQHTFDRMSGALLHSFVLGMLADMEKCRRTKISAL
jgi:hypothetical protein